MDNDIVAATAIRSVAATAAGKRLRETVSLADPAFAIHGTSNEFAGSHVCA